MIRFGVGFCHVIRFDEESLGCMVADAVRDLVTFSDEEMLEDLIWPIFYYSGYWIQRMAAEILDLPVGDEYELADLLRRLEEREGNGSVKPNWAEDGF
jgi:hypothetical protein